MIYIRKNIVMSSSHLVNIVVSKAFLILNVKAKLYIIIIMFPLDYSVGISLVICLFYFKI